MRPTLLVACVAALNLVAGGSFGFALARHAGGGGPHDARSAMARHLAMDQDTDFASLADGLRLEPARDAKVRAILGSARPRFDALMRDVTPRLEALHDAILGELRAVLTPEEIEALGAEYLRRQGGRG
ncbi:MAG TPA: hypothetical protein VHF22_04985 [Planctomycetota bacterium]|nr:hypothetical protein [Planctomycetota bacterium]